MLRSSPKAEYKPAKRLDQVEIGCRKTAECLGLAPNSGNAASGADAGTKGIQHPRRIMRLFGASRKKLQDLDVVVKHGPGLGAIVVNDPRCTKHDIVLDFVENVFQLPTVGIIRANQ